MLAASNDPTAFDNKTVDCPFVFRHRGQFYLAYIGYDGTGYQTGLASSKDLVQWKKLGCILPRDPNSRFTSSNSAMNWIVRENPMRSPGQTQENRRPLSGRLPCLSESWARSRSRGNRAVLEQRPASMEGGRSLSSSGGRRAGVGGLHICPQTFGRVLSRLPIPLLLRRFRQVSERSERHRRCARAPLVLTFGSLYCFEPVTAGADPVHRRSLFLS